MARRRTSVTSPEDLSLNVDTLIVNSGGTGILHGNLTTYTVNQYIIPPTKDDFQVPQVRDLVVDAVKLSSDTTQTFFPNDKTSHSQLCDDKESLEGLQRRWCYLIAVVVSLSFVTLVTCSIFSLISPRNTGREQRIPQYGTLSDQIDDNSSNPADLPNAPRMVSRALWMAQPPKKPLDNNTLPVQRVIVCHTAADKCLTTADCILKVRYTQLFHVESKKWDDIAYNFLVGGDGCVYDGRGWDKMGAHTKGKNNGTLGIAFVGTYITEMPNQMQLEAFNKLISLGVKIKKISENYTLVAQCQLQSTAAPGITLAKNMASWPHFDRSLPIMCTP